MDINVNKKKTPLYYQIYDYFKNKIRTEELKEGEGLPPERDLAKIFEVSRETVRQALKKLEEENYIYRIHGNGTFVSNKIIQQDLTNFYSFYEETVKTGKIPSSKVLGYDIINADEEMIEIFKIPSSVNILHIKRLRLIDDVPAIYEDTFIPLNRFEGFDAEMLNEKPMYSIFREVYNVSFEKAMESFSPVLVENKKILNHLGYKHKAVCMLIKRLTYEKSKIIQYTVSYARGDKYEYKVTLNNI